jgi:hypothetical protein
MDLKWRKSTRSDANGGACVEIAVVEQRRCQS